ncbi:hypothetical protein OGAPHI_003608 [Ogataea philodendri]|uniref:Uncharacterized protein n=1 Tax=Ogataea philodendri TaxID=1378263 RepID=A0A9P8P5M1_9ASCO|nr:uncharacterized protein OGAPHI_003608 [Ogataea philodendri]KAH3665424.1 hypothetical protein OGAPHI_003608 [Ogataea philodendri]
MTTNKAQSTGNTNKTDSIDQDTLMARNTSVLTLTTPQLYSIYGGEENLIDQPDETAGNIYADLKENIYKRDELDHSEVKHVRNTKSKPKTTSSVFVEIFIKLLTLCVFGNLFIKLTEQLHTLNPTLPNFTDFRIFYVFKDNAKLNLTPLQTDILNNSLTGLILGAIRPLSDRVFSQKVNNKTLFETSSIIRSTVALIGLSYCLRKVEWQSKLQAASVFLLVSTLLWIILDSTLGGFLSSSIGAIGTMAVYTYSKYQQDPEVVLQDHDIQADLLWIGSFLFITLVIFGKISKRLIG